MRILLALTLIVSSLGAEGKINKAVIASGILPGTGEWMLGDRTKGEFFLWADGILWLIWGSFCWYGSTQNNNARLFAGAYAGASLHQKEEYYVALEEFDNSDEYNGMVLREARRLYPDNTPDAYKKREEYLKEHGYFGYDAWNWEPDTLRYGEGVSYWEIRRSARVALQRASFAFGSLILNRIVSVIDVIFFTKEKPLSKKTGFLPVNDRPGLVLIYRF